MERVNSEMGLGDEELVKIEEGGRGETCLRALDRQIHGLADR